ncbi:PREDICTED: gamma-tubulin complex component 3 [Nicrophorus vespilloides]|uniref:Gamma-tubulin complex component 3 n=1 Tax=Nicrophorus vespilloides TaxID=110193 RepID=A0ABM1N7Z1_NICVS|nr:PREDICTED: gamma-tubulin complex component 3 [Nicrophorus vespilloides]
MHKTASGEGSGTNKVPVLLQNLCNYFSKQDQELSSKLYKLSISYLSTSSQNNLNNECDAQYVVSQIRKQIQSTQSSEQIGRFDHLYGKLQKSTVLKHQSQVLIFLLSLSTGSTETKVNQWSLLQDIPEQTTLSVSKSQMSFLPDDPKVGVKKLYQASSLVKNVSALFNRTQLSSTGWTGSEQDLLKTSTSSSRQTLMTGVTESQLIQEVIYSFQGIEGRVIRKELDGLGFTIDAKLGKSLTPIQKGLIERLVGVGFLHNQLKLHCDESDKQIGLIGQSLIAILRDELTNYYQLIASLQAQSNKQELTLRRMVVWVAEPQLHLQWLAYIAEQCSDKKGGALISAVHGFLQHGSTCVQKLAEKVLTAVCRPLCLMLSKWLLDGELNDPCAEFFIEARSINTDERLWHDKYLVRKAMIPSFISLDQATKILATGKSINFLRQVCKDNEEMPGRDALHKLFTNTFAKALFAPEQSIELHTALERVYRETSQRVLDLLKDNYRLLEHLQSMRRYLLLGQGDFIRHLMELLVPELSQPAANLYLHTLSAILETAIRVTNAQYEDEDTLQRLNVNLLSMAKDDSGWDVFILGYHANGPVGTILQPTNSIYKCLFGGLWKVKRMEFVLSNMRKQQITSNKLYRNIKEMKPVTHAIHILASEMIHFLHQTQYYFLFEVLECSWAEMVKQVNQAGSLDDVITAHNTFLSSVQSGVLLDLNSANFRLVLGLIFNQILSLESLQETLYMTASKAKEQHEAYKKICCSKDGFGVTKEEEQQYKKQLLNFHHFLSSTRSQVIHWSTMFRENVVKFIKLLAASSNMNLQLLSTRLNFNGYYTIA